MIYIAHRGNTNGPFLPFENHPSYIRETIKKGYYCEIDVWYNIKDNSLELGHDKPEYLINILFILELKNKLYCHCKNIDAFNFLLGYEGVNCFFHDIDECTLTSNKEIWTYPGKKITKKSIVVMPERFIDIENLLKDYIKEKNPIGICSDYIEQIKNILN